MEGSAFSDGGFTKEGVGAPSLTPLESGEPAMVLPVCGPLYILSVLREGAAQGGGRPGSKSHRTIDCYWCQNRYVLGGKSGLMIRFSGPHLS